MFQNVVDCDHNLFWKACNDSGPAHIIFPLTAASIKRFSSYLAGYQIEDYFIEFYTFASNVLQNNNNTQNSTTPLLKELFRSIFIAGGIERKKVQNITLLE